MADAQGSVDEPLMPLRRQRACLPCSKAKARCNFRDNNAASGCERCSRMKVECAPQTTKVLRRPRQLKPFSSRVAPSRQKIDDITSLSEASSNKSLSIRDDVDAVGDDSSLRTPSSIPTPDYLDNNSFQSFGLDTYGHPSPHLDLPPFSTPPVPNYPPPPSLDYGGVKPASPGFGLTWNVAEQAISLFKTKFTPEFPFVTLSHEMFAEQLYFDKPLLFKVIMLVAAPITIAKQREIKRMISRYIGQHLLVLEERELDLLQGLLAFIAWGNHGFHLDQQNTQLIYLAVGLAHNLGITRFPPSCTQIIKQAANPVHVNGTVNGRISNAAVDTYHSLEEMRAFLGCYYITSINSSQFGRCNSLRNDYVDYCLNYVVQSADYWTDSNLEKMVQLQLVVDHTLNAALPADDSEHHESLACLATDHLRPVRARLYNICETFNHDQVQSATFWLHFNHALVRLYEPAIWTPSSPTELDSFCRCQSLLFCLQAARSFFTAFLMSSPEDLLSHSFVSFAEMVTVLVTASRLLLLNTDDWDLGTARQTLDLPVIMDQLATAFTNASLLRKQRALENVAGVTIGLEDYPDDEKGDPFLQYVKKIKWIRVWFQSRLAAGGAVLPDGLDVALPDLWSLDESASSQFWLGLTGNFSWSMFSF